MADAAMLSDPCLDQMVGAIVEQVAPELLLLFGSRARGDAREDSDYDLMLVVRDPTAVESSRIAASAATRGVGPSAEILARSIESYQRWQHDPGFLDYIVSREGKLLYSTGAVPQRCPVPARVREPGGIGEGLAMWIQRADADLRLAESSLVSAEPVWDAICFHSHACVEKLLKALIVRRGTFPPKTHELRQLRQLQPDGIAENERLIAICTLLDDLFPKSRYPEAPFPTPDEARQAIVAAREGRDLLLPVIVDTG